MRTLCFASEKGGVGKTTSAINVAVGLAKLGNRVLMIDADPQANASLIFLSGQQAEPPTLYHVLTNTADAGDTIRPSNVPGLDLMPAETLLADANVTLAGEMGRERRLRLAMRGVSEDYDFVIIDTSPQRTLINTNVLNYVAEVYCPVDPGIFSLSGLGSLQGAISEVVRYLDNQPLRLAGLVLTRTQRDNLSRDVEAQVRAAFGNLVAETSIPASTKVGEAHARFLSVLDYAPRSPGAKAYEALTREIIAHGQAIGTGDGEHGGASEADDEQRRTYRRGARAAG